MKTHARKHDPRLTAAHAARGGCRKTAAGNVAKRSDRIAVENHLAVLSGHCAGATFPAVVCRRDARTPSHPCGGTIAIRILTGGTFAPV